MSGTLFFKACTARLAPIQNHSAGAVWIGSMDIASFALLERSAVGNSGAQAAGMNNVNVDPTPSSLSTVISPDI